MLIFTYLILYCAGQLLGHGGFAKVFRCKNRETGESVAIKVIEKERLSADPSMIERISNEIRIHSRLSHPNIVEFKTCFQDESSIYIVLEPCSHGNLYRLFKTRTKLSESEVASIMNQLLSALEYLHAQGIVHRDLKLSNIVLNEKLIVKLWYVQYSFTRTSSSYMHISITATLAWQCRWNTRTKSISRYVVLRTTSHLRLHRREHTVPLLICGALGVYSTLW